jgi:hypothetical protein
MIFKEGDASEGCGQRERGGGVCERMRGKKRKGRG